MRHLQRLHLSHNPAIASYTANERAVAQQGLIACHYRAAEWRHKEIELAAHDLLQLLDTTSA